METGISKDATRYQNSINSFYGQRCYSFNHIDLSLIERHFFQSKHIFTFPVSQHWNYRTQEEYTKYNPVDLTYVSRFYV
jgi:hypothetical protein